MSESAEPCLRCGEAPAIDKAGMCGHCHWLTRLDIDRGLREFEIHLTKHARFDDWERERRTP